MNEFLETYRTDEMYMEAAYSGLPIQTKGWIKKTIALAHNLYPSRLGCTEETLQRQNDWHTLTVSLRPADRLLLLYPAEYPAATRAVAAAAPALFLGVDEVMAVAVLSENPVGAKKFRYAPEFSHQAEGLYPETPLNFNVLGAWELTGVEDVFLMPEARLLKFLKKLEKAEGRSRIIVLGSPGWLGQLTAFAGNAQCRIWQEPHLPHICLNTEDRQLYEIVKNIHPDLKVKVLLEEPDNTLEFKEKIFTDDICLSRSHAGCWAWGRLEPGFFMSRQIAVE
ncbi:MAG: hypothetical protein IJD04_04635 [Desulfovibrionaceae bacterium]|nr:hypothetical protein [Desulfovibrionaceae bacterium]